MSTASVHRSSLNFARFAAIPLAVPLPDLDVADLRHHVQTYCDQCRFEGNLIRYVISLTREQARHAGPFHWKPAFEQRFSGLVRWVEALPFQEIYGVDLVTQTADVGDHLDIFGHNNSETHLAIHEHVEPIYYRAIFVDDAASPTRNRSFYIAREFGGPRQYLQMPRETVAFALNSSTCYHGAKFHPGYFKTTMAIYGKLDEAAHHRLLQKSLDRFGDCAIDLEEVTPVAGPGAQFPYPGAR
jgi:hypothetical protein